MKRDLEREKQRTDGINGLERRKWLNLVDHTDNFITYKMSKYKLKDRDY